MRLVSGDDKLDILLIEDNKGDATLITRAIEWAIPQAHSIDRAETLEQALKQLSTSSYDVALLDRSLPDAVGFDGLHIIQNMAPQLPVVFLTAYQDEETSFEAIEQGAQDYLFKDKIDGHTIKRAIQYAVLRKQHEGVLILRANFDMLTGLANRILFESRLEMALAKMRRGGGQLGLLYLDLDRFKQANDLHGHAAGDAVLKEVGKRLKQALRPYDTTARMGGDEFAVLLESLGDDNDAKLIANKILALFDEPIIHNGKVLDIGVSIGGITCHGKEHGAISLLLEQADMAMYEAKSKPGSHVCFYEIEKKSAC